jgi:hypothetical protein
LSKLGANVPRPVGFARIPPSFLERRAIKVSSISG